MQVVTDSKTVARLAGDAGLYDDGAPEVKPTAEWPMPTDGYRLRTYRLADIDASGGMVNAFRTRKLMVAPYDRFLEPRDETALTPHSHADFEQASVALEGDWIHHLRAPWTANRHDSRPDDHLEIGKPLHHHHPGRRGPYLPGRRRRRHASGGRVQPAAGRLLAAARRGPQRRGLSDASGAGGGLRPAVTAA